MSGYAVPERLMADSSVPRYDSMTAGCDNIRFYKSFHCGTGR